MLVALVLLELLDLQSNEALHDPFQRNSFTDFYSRPEQIYSVVE